MKEAVRFLTILPLPGPHRPMPPGAAIWFPVVGAVLGLLGVAMARLPLPPPLAALLVLAVWALVTGGLHEDGLADTFDAFGGGRSREDIFRILKDSRLGAFGALALVLSVLIRWQALIGAPPATLVACQALPRAGIVALAWLAGPAGEGLGGAWAAGLRWWHAAAASLLGAATAAAGLGEQAAPPVVLCAVIVLASTWYFRRRIGGVTGDCLGAANQLQEMAVLVWLAA
jgi:adenosylcobinamide-GDP ribazoletransferase